MEFSTTLIHTASFAIWSYRNRFKNQYQFYKGVEVLKNCA
ncbi:hypothetical protein LEP1GSC008_3274 [Leptospira kirschneri serovar Bulgarica str. Nikolaevo]|uniref:Uncharacterized protein n=1 Tax=Leptospira kirschneri serovar Bulgarica str. Nikolaevo TaxID=1240687 RepID=M6F7V6_9LEPT|nr:hypothetical protein LEP1GSC008_3274 [Leptospira kirschneri serovar Bulgarica str. Nikolaevo]